MWFRHIKQWLSLFCIVFYTKLFLNIDVVKLINGPDNSFVQDKGPNYLWFNYDVVKLINGPD